MGRRDIRNKETKKPKKDAKKNQPVIPMTETIIVPPAEVEVVKKRRKREEEE